MKIKLLLTTFALFALLLVGNLNAQFSGGLGTEANPYQIASKADLAALADSVNKGNNWSINKYFKLTKDITDSIRTPIAEFYPFQGDFNGQGHKITLAVNRPDLIPVGLFRFASEAKIYDVVIDGYVIGGTRVGGIVGSSVGSSTIIKNCVNNADITAVERGIFLSGGFAGGIVGVGNADISYCTNNGKVSGGVYIGGIIGQGNGSMKNCINTGSISSTERIAGGIAGCFMNTVEMCANSGHISGDSLVGGISGHLHIGTKIKNCVNIGTVIGNFSVGGISTSLSEFASFEIFNCINSGLIIGKRRVGGILGNIDVVPIFISDVVISNCINTGVVLGSDGEIGGIVGNISLWEDRKIIENCYYDKQMCIYGGINNIDEAGRAEGFLTKELTGNNLLAKLGTTDWTYNNNIYPALQGLENETISKIAASPVFLCSDDIDDYDKYNNIRHNFQVSTSNSVVWQSALGNVKILSSNVDVVNSRNRNDTLIAAIGSYKKIIPLILNDNKICGTIPPIELDSFNLVLNVNPDNVGTATSSGKYEEEQKVEIEAIANDCYKFLNWSDSEGNIISTSAKDTITIIRDSILTANFEYTCDTEPEKFKFYIRASTHPLLNPRWRNYPIPIYIKADKDISNAIIEQLVIETDRTLFYPHKIGHLTSRDNGFMIFENILVPNLVANEEQLLFDIWGAVLLGDKDSCAITINSAKFSDDLDVELEFIAGYLTIEICRAGGDRLLRWFDYEPAVLVKNNPVDSKVLEVECRTIEIGNYSLEVIDLLGHTTIIKEWSVTPTTSDLIFNFDISIDNFNFTSGNYLLVMNTPTSRYITKFVVSK